MRKRGYRLFISVMLTMLLVLGLPGGALAAEEVKVSVPVAVKTEGAPSKPEEFRVVLKPADPSNPMPEGSVNGEYALNVKDKAEFPQITFGEVGVYSYTVSQAKGSAKGWEYDPTVYNLKITISNTDNGDGLKSTVTLRADQSGDKLAELTFRNAYKPAPNPPTPNPPAPKPPTPNPPAPKPPAPNPPAPKPPAPNPPAPNPPKPVSPKTGDAAPIAALFAAAVLSTGAFAVVSRKKREVR